MNAARNIIIGSVVIVLLALTGYSQTDPDQESLGYSRTENLKALAGGYGGGLDGDESIIMPTDDNW